MLSTEIKRLRKRSGLNQYELGELVDMSQASVASWENGSRKPSPDMIVKLAKVFGVSTDELLEANDEISGIVEGKALRVPVLGSIPAGVPIEAIEDILDWEEVPADWGRGGKEYFALKVHGNSMLPEYRDGDVVIFRKADTCESGQDCAVMANGDDATFKRVKWSPKGVMLQALNPDYDSYVYTSKEWEESNGRILGVVVELRRKV